MKPLLGLVICCVLSTFIQARVIIIDDNNDDVSVRKDRTETNLTAHEVSDLKTCTKTKDNHTQVRPEASPGVLLNTFHLIFKKIGIFLDSSLDSRRVLIRNVFSGKCISMKKDTDGEYTKGIEVPCQGDGNKENNLVSLKHVGDGYVALTLPKLHCLGAGFDPWSYVYVSASGSWCWNSHSHHWAIVQRGNHVVFKQRESNRCLTSWPKWEELFVDNNDCKQDDPYQGYQICDQTETKCWPPNAEK